MQPRDIAAATAIVLLWSVNFSVNKIAVSQLPPVHDGGHAIRR